MMNMKKTYIILGTTILSISAFTGCNSTDNSSLVSAFSDSIMEIEIPEPADSLNEGVSLNRGNASSENKIDADGSAIGTDGPTDEEVEQEINEVEDQQVEDTSNFSGGDVDYSNEPWYVEGIDYSRDNNGQGYDSGGKHFDTLGELNKYEYEKTMSNTDFLTDEELETLVNGGTIMN